MSSINATTGPSGSTSTSAATTAKSCCKSGGSCCGGSSRGKSTGSCCSGGCTRDACGLLTWSDPAYTAKVFGSILSVLLIVKYTNFPSWFFYLTSLVLALSATAEYVGRVATGQGFISKIRPAPETAIGDFFASHASILADALRSGELDLQNLFAATDVSTTFKAAGLSYILYYVTYYFGLWTLAFWSTVVTFTLPKVYASNKTQIDAAAAEYTKHAKKFTADLTETVQKKIEPAVASAKSKVQPLLDQVKAKIPVRTAGSTVDETATATTTSSQSAATSTTQVNKPPSATEVTSSLKEQVTKAASTVKDASEKEPLLN